MNIECSEQVLDELENAFRFNDAVIRKLILQRKDAVTTPSSLSKSKEEEAKREAALIPAFDEDEIVE
jgi:small subunit ribosomal protein S6